MATMRQIGSFGYLPLSKEVLFEIQVSNFINDFLFSSVDDCKPPVPSCFIDVEKAKPLQSKHGHSALLLTPRPSFTLRLDADIAQQNAGAAGAVPTPLSAGKDGIWYACKTMTESCRSTDERCSNRSVLLEQIRIDVNEPEKRFPNPEAQLGAMPKEGSSECEDEAMAMDGERSKVKCAKLSKMETFPCKTQVQRERQLSRNDCEAETEIKPSSRKPPRPPRSARQSSHALCNGLIRCASDTHLLLQVSRRAKLERKRKLAAANSSASSITSMWALIFTLCFAGAMLVQGVLPQHRQKPAETSNAFTPANPYTFPTKVEVRASASEVNRLGVVSSSADTFAKSLSKGNVGRERQTLDVHIGKGVDKVHTYAPAT